MILVRSLRVLKQSIAGSEPLEDKQEMIEEFPELQTSLNDLQQQKQQYRLMQ